MRTKEKKTRALSGLKAAVAALLLMGALAQVQAATAQEADMGTIPGTQMRRDEFRGRALAQLCAIAVNALTYQLVNGEYPQDFAHLRGSQAWNLDLTNMFSGQRLRSIYFEPQPGDMTTAPSNGFVPSFDIPVSSAPLPSDPGAGASGDGNQGPPSPGFAPVAIGNVSRSVRVDPRVIQDVTPGDVFYYTKDNLLQLIIFAPDHTYVEWVDEVPNANFRESLNLSSNDTDFPADLYSLQVLYYTQDLLPEYLSLFRFMASQDSPPQAALQAMSAEERLPMSQEYGVTVLNPVTHQAAAASADPVPGDFVAGGGGRDNLLAVWLGSGKSAVIEDLQAKGALPGQTAPPEGKQGGKPKVKDTPKKPRIGGGRPSH